MGHRLGRGADGQRAAAEGDLPLAPLEVAEKSPPYGVMAGTPQADKPKNLAGVQGEADRPGAGGHESFDLEQGRRRGWGRRAEQLLQRPADDQLDQPARGRPAHRLAADAAPVPEHGDAIGDPKHLVEAVADIEDAEAPPAQAAERRQQPGDVGLREGGGGLVEDQHVRLDGERPGDADERALGGAQAAHPGIGIDPAADAPPGPRSAASRVARQEISPWRRR